MIDREISNLTDAIESKMDRSKWKKYKFSDLVENIVEKVVPKNSGLKHYIGLEHLDSGSLKINRFGATESLIGDKLKIYKGDLIFAKRNSYLKRVAIADFNAVASAHSMVLRPKQKNVDPKFLPFFMMSEVFWKRAIEISVGSLSPTINWKSIAKQEFLLPPKAEQASLSDLLWAIDEVIEKEKGVLERLEKLKNSKLKETFKKENCIKLKIGSISESLDNRRIPIKSSIRTSGEYPYYGASGIVDYVSDFIFDEEILLISEDGENLNSRNLPIAYSVNEKCWVNNHAHVLKIKNASRYLVKEYFNFTDISDFITSGTRPKLNKGVLMEMPIYMPFGGNEIKYEKDLLGIDTSKLNCFKMINASINLQKSLINQIF
jgi:type I restriction enzyme S subunit